MRSQEVNRYQNFTPHQVLGIHDRCLFENDNIYIKNTLKPLVAEAPQQTPVGSLDAYPGLVPGKSPSQYQHYDNTSMMTVKGLTASYSTTDMTHNKPGYFRVHI